MDRTAPDADKGSAAGPAMTVPPAFQTIKLFGQARIRTEPGITPMEGPRLEYEPPTLLRDTEATIPLCVSLDGTLLPGNLLAERVFALIKASPGVLLRLPFWFARGPAELRRQVSRRSTVDVARLPYDGAIVELLRAERQAGRSLVLVSTGDARAAQAIATHLGFDEVVSEPTAAGLERALTARFGPRGFDVLGSERQLRNQARHVQRFPSIRPTPNLRILLRAVRAHQWLKNILIFLPVVAAQRLTEGPVMSRALLAFVTFSLVASCVYVLNDLLDLEEDRRHATKRNRPFASGQLPLTAAPIILVFGLGTAAVISVLSLPPAYSGVLAFYFVLTFAYSVKLKGAVLIDVFTLACLYTVRVLAGAAATGIQPSVWLLGFSMFFFLSLALVKRYAELHSATAGGAGLSRLPGRSYRPGDLPVLVAMGVASGCMSVLVLALYVISDEFAAHYQHQALIWLLCPLTLYWIGRAWIVVARDEMHHDPLIWAARDHLSRLVALAVIAILFLAR